MKKYYLITSLLLCTSTGFSQCGEVFLFSQKSIDEFSINNPGCTEPLGLIIIGLDINNLDGLSQVTKVGGLVIQNVPNLTDYSGLNNLTSTTSSFGIQGTTASSISGFPNLTSVGSFGISNCTASTISGFNNLVNIGGLLLLENNLNLISISGMNNIASVQMYYIYNNSSLTTIPGTLTIGTDAYITNNTALTSLSGLDNLTSINGNFQVTNNPNLSSLTGLNSLSSIGGPLQIQNNDALLNLNGLDNLATINGVNGTLHIVSNLALNSLTALKNLRNINGGLNITDNNSLTSLSGLDNINPIGIKSLQLYNCNQLSICNVQSICSNLEIYYNLPAIHDNLPGCASIEEIRVACGNNPTFGAVSPQELTACDAATETISLSSLVPGSTSTVSYNINNGSTVNVANIIADGSGNADFDIVLSAANNNQTLTITAIERTDVPSPPLNISTNNTVLLHINNNVTYYADTDADTFGDNLNTLTGCPGIPVGYVANNTDCAPTDGNKWQSASLYIDADGDGYDNGSAPVCYGVTIPNGYRATTLGTDCNDNNGNIHPNIAEICDGIDNNCNGTTDEGCPVVSSISIGNASKAEGNNGQSKMVFTVTLNQASSQKITVRYATNNVTASAASDYVATSGTLTFRAGITTQSISVPVKGDKINEANETFTVILSNPSSAQISNAAGTGTIINDDPLTIARETLTEIAAFKAIAYPNPFAENFKLEVTTSGNEKLGIKVYDITGQVIEEWHISVSEIAAQEIGGGYPSGIYNIIVTQGGEIKSVRIIKR